MQLLCNFFLRCSFTRRQRAIGDGIDQHGVNRLDEIAAGRDVFKLQAHHNILF